MPFMILSSPTMLFKHLCFIDTPGHNPSNQGYTGGDRQASKEYLNHAKHILWFISCERGGIEKSDLDYLQELYEEGKQVFIVLGKADSRTKKQLEEIAVQIKETLENNGIEFLGISAYSSKTEGYQEIKEFSEKSLVFDSLEKFLTELNKRSEKQNEILSVLYEIHLAYEKAIQQDADKFKRYQKALHSIKLDLMQKGFDDFSDASFNKIESLKKEFSEQERSKRENLVQLNQVINLFKKSIDKVFDSVSAFTWEKYKEENDDENDEENYREFEEIKKMVLYFRDCWMFVVEQLDGKSSQTELQKYKGFVNRNNKLLQLEFSLKNLLVLREYRKTHKEVYQESLNNKELQNDLREWRDLRNTPVETNRREFEYIKEIVLYFRDCWMFVVEQLDGKSSQTELQKYKGFVNRNNKLLQLEFSLKNLLVLREYRKTHKEVYQESLNNKELQNDLREWRDLRNTPVETNRREFEYIKEIVLYFRDCWMFVVEQLDGKSSQTELQKYKGFVNRNNKLLQLEFSLKNLLVLREYRKTHKEVYQESLNNKELQNDLREWRRSKR
ncbi:hypothetical protein VN0834_14110 [Helicobacter pylori]